MMCETAKRLGVALPVSVQNDYSICDRCASLELFSPILCFYLTELRAESNAKPSEQNREQRYSLINSTVVPMRQRQHHKVQMFPFFYF